MRSPNVLLYENVLKCVKCVENPLQSYFDTQYFTLAAMGNFNNADKNNISRMKYAHGTQASI